MAIRSNFGRIPRAACSRAAVIFCCLLASGAVFAQAPQDLAAIVERLERLERENRELSAQLRAMQARLDGTADPSPAVAAPVSLEQRVAITESRAEEVQQTKVEASQKFPVRLTGMALFNAYSNSRQAGGSDYPAVAGPTGSRRAGATVRQTVIGLEYRGPSTFWGGHASGSVQMDFFAGANNPTLRVRTASIDLAWKTRSIAVGLEKPIFNPREPASLAQVGISPLTGAGNLWLWLPQARVEQAVSFARNTGLRATLGILQTRETAGGSGLSDAIEAARPAFEGRFELYHQLDDERRLEFAPGFHRSVTHAGGTSTESSLVSMDWFFNPWRRLEFTGAFYSGQNVAPLGNGYQQGFVLRDNRIRPVHSRGGWGQLTIRAAPRVDLHLFAGQQDDDNRDLVAGRIGKNLQNGANVYFRLAPNVLLGLEGSQVRTWYLGEGWRINNHYDVALGYFF
jgi:hypothetical protein